MIKFVSGMTLQKVLDDHKSVENYLKIFKKNQNTIEVLMKNYFKSCGKSYLNLAVPEFTVLFKSWVFAYMLYIWTWR